MSDYSFAIEVFKTFTPYVLATVVYYFWHVQKGKEVIASESKNVIMQLNEVSDLGSNIFGLIFEKVNHRNVDEKSLSKEELKTLENALNSYEIKFKDVLNSLDFLEGAINDNNIKKIREMAFLCFYCALDEYHTKIIHLELNEYKDNEDMVDQNVKLQNEITEMKKMLYVYALYKTNIVSRTLKL